MSDSLPWKFADPHIEHWQIQPSHIDHYNHVNNVAYLSQLERLAWAHSQSLGLHFDNYQALDRGMVIRRHELDYLQPAHLGDELLCATWITHCDHKLTLRRAFQFMCARRRVPVFEAQTQFICISLSTGAPKRMPPLFRKVYGEASLQRVGHAD